MSAVRTMIPIARPVLGEREVEAARRAILSGWVTQGPEVAAFEQEFAAVVGARHACAVSSCTTALHLALVACGVGAGDEVVTVSHSFIATANAIRYCGATPVFVDVDLDTFNMDASQLAAAIGPRTKAILAVHQLGMPCDLEAITRVARDRHLPRDRGRGVRHRQPDSPGTDRGSPSAGRTVTSPASRSTRGSCCRLATAEC